MTTSLRTSLPLFRWYVYDTVSPWKKKGGWRELSWEMTEADAAEWARKNGIERIEKVSGSEKVYKDVDGR
jgi:hypothetical protein